MADIRIKDLTTLASASLTGDVFVIDGTTGTRKLSAFSPTFGGSVVATGGLTSSGPISTSVGITANEGTFTGGYAVLRNYGGSADTGALFLGQSGNSNFVSGTLTTIANYIGGAAICSTVAAGFRVLTTTASTSTSTGALVVGNGTSGGLGVGGSIYAGDNINSVNPQGKIQIQGTGNTTGVKEINLLRSDGGDACTLGLTGSAYNGALLAGGLGNNEAFIYNAAPFRVFIGTASTTRFDFTSSQFKINPTTISNSTSSGALVVSGGVGVAGAINAGDTITSTTSTNSGVLQLNLVNSSTGTSASSLFRFNAGTRTATLQAYNDTHATLAGQLRVGTSNGDIVLIPSGVAAATFGASSISLGALSSATTIIGGDTGSGTNILLLKDGLGTLKVNFKGNGDVAVLSSTASTSTSSGALVVSGGVGVGGAIYAGGDLTVDKTEPTITFKRAANTNLNIVNFWTGAAADFGIGLRNTTDSDLHIYNYGTSNDALKIAKSDSLATFGGAVRTAAPSGGTAANWKLGTVATVSPTSPNRTIEVDIGGTTYYIHAKTTNN